MPVTSTTGNFAASADHRPKTTDYSVRRGVGDADRHRRFLDRSNGERGRYPLFSYLHKVECGAWLDTRVLDYMQPMNLAS